MAGDRRGRLSARAAATATVAAGLLLAACSSSGTTLATTPPGSGHTVTTEAGGGTTTTSSAPTSSTTKTGPTSSIAVSISYKRQAVARTVAGATYYDLLAGPCQVFKVNYANTNLPDVAVTLTATFNIDAGTVVDADTRSVVTSSAQLPSAVRTKVHFPGTEQAGVLSSNGMVVTYDSCASPGAQSTDWISDETTGGSNVAEDSESDFLWGSCNSFKVKYSIDNQGVTGTSSITVPAGSYYWFNSNADISSAGAMPSVGYGAFPRGQQAGVLRDNRLSVSTVRCAT